MIILFCLAGPALADDALSADEMRIALFGVHLFGVETGGKQEWDECIDPEGRTVFRFETNAYSQIGQLRIAPDPLACFSYPPDSDPTPACWRVIRHRGQLAFVPPSGGTMFVTRRIETGITDCPPPFAQLSSY